MTVREVPVPGLLGDVYGDCAAELADVYEHVMLARGRSVVVRVTDGGRMGVAVVDIDTGGVQTVLDGPRSCSPVGLAGDRLVVTRQSAETYPELAVVDLVEGPASERRLVAFADRLDPFAVVERFDVRSPDGWELDAWFLSAHDAVRPLPTVLVVHGGPHFAYGEAFSLDAQALCRAGFGVLYTNPRGSTGYGDAFAHAVHGDWAEGPTRDVLAVVDAAVDRGWVDPARLGVTGNSYGGYLAAWLASTTSRFGAAVIENPVTDLLGMFGTSDIGRRFFPAQLGGQPHEIADVYLAQSPLLQAHRCRTPSLFVTGELDRRCPPGQAWAMHRVLYQSGTPSEVLVLPGASHEGSTYGPVPARLAHDEALVDWMARWLCGRELLTLPSTESPQLGCSTVRLTGTAVAWEACMKPGSLPVVYSAPWCGYCIRLKSQMEREGVAYDEVDVDQTPEALPKLEELNGGQWIIPTVEFPDGSALVNPSLAAVVAKLNQQ